ncbi:biotin/lipoyl-binding protein [Coralloluteibacterium stylophorae]|uniref:HlyD family secretion protein n=1 Tax=Coralloluteibacterium stylophorae TaxID=1776034 RepID=A0A8J8B050_9GAMM|nr:HlyD family secretion protein [Coralloluteibacterium stylophorae]MBS7459032.1 HlyD family secretion protein [Coralloluteibacterium stylophorae]
MKTATLVRIALTTVVVLVAALVAHALWRHYMLSPWTRDGRVRAEIVRVAPDVSGLVAEVAVADNQHVEAGELLFVVDRARFEYAVAQAEANLAAAQAAAEAAGASISAAAAGAAASAAEFEARQQQARRRERIPTVISAEARADAEAAAAAAQATWRRAQAGRSEATASQQQALAAVEQAQVALDRARLDLERTEVRAPTAGTITNLDLRVGDYAQAGSAGMALVSSEDMWIYGYFEETKLPFLHVGDPVEIRLMAGGVRLDGEIESIARGIADRDNPTDATLLASVDPTFNWIRLAQRVPVRVRIDEASIPADTVLAAGMTATVIAHPRAEGAAGN